MKRQKYNKIYTEFLLYIFKFIYKIFPSLLWHKAANILPEILVAVALVVNYRSRVCVGRGRGHPVIITTLNAKQNRRAA